MTQDTIAILIVAITAIYAAYKLYKSITEKKTAGCGGCSSCPSKPDVLNNIKTKNTQADVSNLKEMRMNSTKRKSGCCS